MFDIFKKSSKASYVNLFKVILFTNLSWNEGNHPMP